MKIVVLLNDALNHFRIMFDCTELPQALCCIQYSMELQHLLVYIVPINWSTLTFFFINIVPVVVNTLIINQILNILNFWILYMRIIIMQNDDGTKELLVAAERKWKRLFGYVALGIWKSFMWKFSKLDMLVPALSSTWTLLSSLIFISCTLWRQAVVHLPKQIKLFRK